MNTKLFLPYKGRVKLTSPYGHRKLNGVSDFHKGIDLVGLDSKEIIAPFEGKVTSSIIITDKDNLTWEWGNYVKIESGLFAVFLCHMKERFVKVGDYVKVGQPIGIEGDTGYTFGAHCHFELRINKTTVDITPFIGIKNEAGIYKNSYDFDTPSEWAKEACAWAKTNGILKGDSDTENKFRYHDPITREEALVFLHRLWSLL